MTISISVGTLFIIAVFVTANNHLHPLSDDFISLINSKQNSWKAGRNFPLETPLAHIEGLMGVLDDPLFHNLPTQTHDAKLIASLPENFDPREKWPNCPSLDDIRDQGSCGSSWAFGAVEAMTDRVCTYSNATKNFYFSAQDLVSCCTDCGYGCLGGKPSIAWLYWVYDGIVSGGPYNSSKGCRPYEFPPCEHHIDGPRPKCRTPKNKPRCVHKCEDGYDVEYKQDKHHGKHMFAVSGLHNIMAELYINGPVEAVFKVYSDFLHYKNGVYTYTTGKSLGFHGIKILGWGVENGQKYWLCANSWNSDWGDKGFFKILRGENECRIESRVVAGEPNLDWFE